MGGLHGEHAARVPDRDVKDLPPEHPLFHTVYNLSTKVQVPNMNSLLVAVVATTQWRHAALASAFWTTRVA